MRHFFILTFVLVVNSAMADCLACWELRKVEVVLTNGSKKIGFVYWNEAWLNENLKNWEKWANKFPESFVELHRTTPNQKVHMIRKLFTVKNDSLFEFKVTTKEDLVQFDINQIKEIKEIDKDSKKYQGAGIISVYTQEEIQILNTNPFATYREEDSVSDTYFLSYKKGVDRKHLKKISEVTYAEQESELKRNGVLLVTISYD
jgi:hypothetical protein